MVNKKTKTMTNKGVEGEEIAIGEMRTAMDNLCLQKQTLKDNIVHVQEL